MTSDERAEAAAARLLEYYRELELIIAMLVVKHGHETEGGYRLFMSDQEAFLLRQKLQTSSPVVIKTYEFDEARYVIDVL